MTNSTQHLVSIISDTFVCICCNITLCIRKMDLALEVQFHGGERWPMEVTSKTYFHVVLCPTSFPYSFFEMMHWGKCAYSDILVSSGSNFSVSWHLQSTAARNVSFFFLRLCGMLWVLFGWIILYFADHVHLQLGVPRFNYPVNVLVTAFFDHRRFQHHKCELSRWQPGRQAWPDQNHQAWGRWNGHRSIQEFSEWCHWPKRTSDVCKHVAGRDSAAAVQLLRSVTTQAVIQCV